MTAQAAIELQGVTRNYAVTAGLGQRTELRALRGISLSVGAGEVLGLVGESGCGKSTLARLILGIEPASAGSVMLDGRPVQTYDRRQRARLIQPVFQDPYSSLNPRMRISAIIGAPLAVQRVRRAERRERVRAMIRSVGLAPHLADAYPAQLSGGQRQRVAIARALIAEPRILVCDEPTSALDVSVQSQILNLIASLRRQALTIVLISHNLAVVNHLSDRVAVMYLGRIVEEGPTEQVFAAPRHPYTHALLRSVLAPEPGVSLADVPIGADPASPLAPPSGCAFHPRCPNATRLCAETEPSPEADGAHTYACHHPV